MKNCALIAIALILSGQCFAKRYVVKAEDLEFLEKEAQSRGGEKVQRLKYHNATVLELNEKSLSELRLQFPELSFEEDIEFKIVGRPSSGGSVSQPPQSIPWGITRVSAIEAQNYTRGAGIIVCVVDTGIQKDHPDLQANLVGGENFIVNKGKVVASEWGDDNDHGTHVAGTIAAIDNSIGVIGVAPEASLFAVKVLDRRGSGYSSAIADGIRSCVRNGAQIISMSLGSASSSSIIQEAVQYAASQGSILIAAAGNDGGPVGYPAAYPEVIAVSATDANNRLASFSNYGPQIDIAAPGVNVLSTTKGSTYKSFNGTSMATPHVSGVMALILASGRSEMKADDIGLSVQQQGLGLINALRSVAE